MLFSCINTVGFTFQYLDWFASFCTWYSYFTGHVIDQTPSNRTVLVNNFATFHCSSFGGFIVWQVNNRRIQEAPPDYNVSFVSIPRLDSEAGENSTLQILGVNSANNTNITCIVWDIDSGLITARSAVVYLTLQGKWSLMTSAYEILYQLGRDHLIPINQTVDYAKITLNRKLVFLLIWQTHASSICVCSLLIIPNHVWP